MQWVKENIITEDGVQTEAQAPIIISASRATDIPAFYMDWLINRFEKGYLKWKNPFNGIYSYISLNKARLIVFWSKNPKPLIKHLDYFDSKGIYYYLQYTLNDYYDENLEPRVPDVNSRIETFIKLSEKIGKEKVIWRFDPFILTDKIGVNELLKKTENIGNQLKNYTEKLVFSFADIKSYNRVRNNLRRLHINYQEFNERTMREIAAGLKELNRKWNFELATCAEQIDFKEYGINHNKCIDDDLMIKLFPEDEVLMDFLGVKTVSQNMLFEDKTEYNKSKSLKDKGQRQFCGCIISKDIGEYNTCPHLCAYCYANNIEKDVLNNYKIYRKNPNREMIKGE